MEGLPRDGISEEGWRGNELPVSTVAAANGSRTVGGGMDTLLLVRRWKGKGTKRIGKVLVVSAGVLRYGCFFVSCVRPSLSLCARSCNS